MATDIVALRKWSKLDKATQNRLLANVFCADCFVTTAFDYEVVSSRDGILTEILRQYFINHPQSIDKYTFLQNSAFTHWVKEKCSKMC